MIALPFEALLSCLFLAELLLVHLTNHGFAFVVCRFSQCLAESIEELNEVIEYFVFNLTLELGVCNGDDLMDGGWIM